MEISGQRKYSVPNPHFGIFPILSQQANLSGIASIPKGYPVSPRLKLRLTTSTLRVIKFIIDLVLIVTAYYIAYLLRFDGRLTAEYTALYLTTLPAVVVIFSALLVFFGIYRGIWKYSSIRDMVLIASASFIGVVAVFFFFKLGQNIYIPRGVLAIFLFVVVAALGGARFLHRVYAIYWPMLKKQKKRVLVVGAGNSGEMIVRQMLQDRNLNFAPIGFVDDDESLHGTRIHGLPVLGSIARLPHLVKARHAAEIILAIPSAGASQMRRVVEFCEASGVPFQTLPGAKELINGQVSVSKIRKVKIEDLLERTPEINDRFALWQQFTDKTVMVTGAAGSIGSELCRQLVKCNIKALVMLDQAESNLFDLDHELKRMHGDQGTAFPVVADVTHVEKIQAVFQKYKPDIVFHAAAYKHVPMMEDFPEEAVRNNVFGTLTVMDAAVAAGAERFVLISTDKAVNPTNVMGATKRVSELFCIEKNGHQAMKTTAVRFGNVLASQGSVIPLFQQQIHSGGPVTVTSKEIERFFMTIPEAVELVLQAGVLGTGGEIFVLDMGEPIKVYDMARHLITLSGFKPDEDIEIKVTGLRPGEKLFEELWSGEEKPESTEHPKIMRVVNTLKRKNNYNHENLERLHAAAEQGDAVLIRSILMDIVPSAKLQ